MQETLRPDDVLVVSNLFVSPKTGDIVIIQDPSQMTEPLVKRVIAVGGQRIRINYNTWEIWVDGELIDSSYVKRTDGPMRSRDFALPDENGIWEDTVPEGEMFVLGDNREISMDSRTLGFIDMRFVIGEVKCRLLPFDQFELY